MHWKFNFTEVVKEFSSNEGLNSLKLLSKSELFNFDYSYNVDLEKKQFTQKLIFTIWYQRM